MTTAAATGHTIDQDAARVPVPLRLASHSDETTLRVEDLRHRPSLRARDLQREHVLALAEVPDRWPAILVSGTTLQVIDGMHRVVAARQLRLTTINARLFHGTDDEAFIEAVQANVQHGLPLSIAERSAAARRLLATSRERSDRAIGRICALDHKTVGRLRAAVRAGDSRPEPHVRVGRDRRVRPVHATAVRARIADAIATSPRASLRQIAQEVGAAPETVRSVRNRIERGEDPRRSHQREVSAPWSPPTRSEPAWTGDTACRSSDDSADFASWFDAAGTAARWCEYIGAVPLSRIYEVADQARRYAEDWRQFADAVERRSINSAS